MLPRHTTSVSLVSLSVESQVHRLRNYISHQNRLIIYFILLFDTTHCPFIHVGFDSLVNEVESLSFNWDIRALICHN